MKDRTRNLIERYEEARTRLTQGAISPETAGPLLFGVGYELDYSGKRDAAENIYQQTIELLEDLSHSKSGSLSEVKLAQFAYNHGKALVKLGRTRAAIGAFRRTIEVLETLLSRGANSLLLEQRASAYAWLALAQRKSGLCQDACQNYETAVRLWERLPESIGAPTNPYSGLLGATLLGYSKALEKIGEQERASMCLQQAQELLQEEFKILAQRC